MVGYSTAAEPEQSARTLLAQMSIERQCVLAYELWMTALSACVFVSLRDHGQALVTELEHRSVSRHQKKHFFDGMAKLGLDAEPNIVVKCAKYHYFSNTLGGLPMHYVEESPTKVWIRYLAPYWMGDGPTQPSPAPAVLSAGLGRAPYLGWHANNGSYLGNDRLIFVQTQSLPDGDPWDGGYFTLSDAPVDGVAYVRRNEGWGPQPDPTLTPELPHATWPADRRAKALRNYAVDFTGTRYAALAEMVGTAETARIVEESWRLSLAQRGEGLRRAFGLEPVIDARTASLLLAATSAVTGDDTHIIQESGHITVEQRRLRLWRDEPIAVPQVDLAIARAWTQNFVRDAPQLDCRITPLPGGQFRWDFHD